MGTRRRTPVRRAEINTIMRWAMLEAGVPEATVNHCSREVCHRFMEKFVMSILDRGRIEIRGMMVGELHPQSEDKLLVRVFNQYPKEDEDGKEGFDFEDCIDR